MNTLEILFRAALFYLIPTMIGFFLYSAGEKIFAKKKTLVHKLFNNLEAKLLGDTDLASAITFLRIPWFFSIGTVFLLVSATIITAVQNHLLPAVEFKQLFFPLSYTLFFVGSITAIIKYFGSSANVSLKELKPLSVLISISLAVALIWNHNTPYSLNWDLYEHQTMSRLIQEGQFEFQTTKISDTFGFSSYPPTFHTLLAISQPLTEESPESVLLYWQYLGYIHLLTVSVTSYYLGLAISRNRSVALLSGVIGTTIFESVIAFTSLFILPQTLTATVFTAAYAGLLLTTEKNHTRIPAAVIAALAASFILMHYVIGTVAAVILLGSYALLYVKPLKNNLNKITWVFLAATIIAVFASYFLNLSWINSGEAASYTFGLSEKLSYALSIYGGSLFIFSLLGCFGLFKSDIPNKQIWTMLLIGFTALMLSNIPYVLKFYTIGRYFFHALMALGIVLLLKQYLSTWYAKVAISVTIATFILLFILNIAPWKQHIAFQGQYTHISQDDLAAAEYLQQYRKDHTQTLALSDPTTMYLMEGLSGINTPGGMFATTATRNQLYSSFSESDIEDMNVELNTINDRLTTDSSRILIISGRSYKWYFADESQRNGFEFNVWKPTQFSFYDRVELDSVISNTTVILYQNPSYIIIKL